MCRTRFCFFILWAASFCLTSSTHAITLRVPGVIVGEPSTLTQDRFLANTPSASVNPNFEYSSYDFSGVGWGTIDSQRRSVALISDQHFVAARHFSPGSNISFLTSTGVKTYTVATGGYSIINNPSGSGSSGPSDLRIGTLSNAIDLEAEGLTSYSVLDPSVNPLGLDTLLYGQRGRIGEGSIDAIQPLTVGGIQGTISYSIYDIATGDPNDAFYTGGDSGGPTFIISNTGDLILSGVHWAIGNDKDPTTEMYSIDTYLPTYISQIESTVSGLTVSVVGVPEPNSILLSATGLCVLLSARRKAP